MIYSGKLDLSRKVTLVVGENRDRDDIGRIR